MELGIEDYVVADVLNQLKKPTSVEDLATETMIRVSNLQASLNELIERGLVEVGKRSGKYSATSLWKSSTKEIREVKEVNPLIHLMELTLVDSEGERVNNFSDYTWSAREAMQAGQLSDKLKSSYRLRYNNAEPTNEDIIESFKLMLDNLPEWHVNNFSLSRLNSDYNGIINTIKSKFRKPAPGSNSIDSVLSRP